MSIRVFLALPLLFLVACNAPSAQFENMSEPELLTYNRSVSRLNQVYCTEEVRVGSHLRTRHCATVRELITGYIGKMNTPSSSISFSQ